MEDERFTTKEVADALITIAPAMQQAWKATVENNALWQRREEMYQHTFILGQFHWYRKLRIWWLRRQL